LREQFFSDLRASHQDSTDARWEMIYKAAFPNYEGSSTDLWNIQEQAKGIDRVIVINGKKYTVEEKYSAYDFDTMLLELWDERNHTPFKKGWMSKIMDGELPVDLFHYNRKPLKSSFIMRPQDLADYWNKNGDRLLSETHRRKHSKNENYYTISWCISVQEVADIPNCRFINWCERENKYICYPANYKQYKSIQQDNKIVRAQRMLGIM